MTKLDDMWKWFAQKEIGICPDMQSFIVDWGGEGRPLLTQALTSTCWSQVRYLAALAQAEKLTDSGIFSIPILRAWFIQLSDWKKKTSEYWTGALLFPVPRSGTYAAAEPGISALSSPAEGKMLVPMETDCISVQDEPKPGAMGIEALQTARAPCVLCRPAAGWLCPLCGPSCL